MKSTRNIRRTSKPAKTIEVNDITLTPVSNTIIIKNMSKDNRLISTVRKIRNNINFNLSNTRRKNELDIRIINYFYKEDLNDFNFADLNDLFEATNEQIIKFFNSKVTVKAVIRNKISETLEEYSNGVVDFVTRILNDKTRNINDILGYSPYTDIGIKNVSNSFNSSYGHHNETSKEVVFEYVGQEFKSKVDYSMSGTSWS